MAIKQPNDGKVNRRRFVRGVGLASAGLLAATAVAWQRTARKAPSGAATFLAKGQSYGAGLERTIRDGLQAIGVAPAKLRGARVLLKPNLVEPSHDRRHATTNPLVIIHTTAVFRSWGAEVTIGEASGNIRDSELIFTESGLQEAVAVSDAILVDLNYADAHWVRNHDGISELDGLYLPREVLTADLVVSMPKLKTHHWVGMTASMKNLYGVLPGRVYGWPKNILHYAGIPQTVVDINAAMPRTIAVVDAIDCMEGDGPIMGSSKPMGAVVIGNNLTAVDAVCARIMGLDPSKIDYLDLASGRLGPIVEAAIDQRGDDWRDVRSPFTILDIPRLQAMKLSLDS